MTVHPTTAPRVTSPGDRAYHRAWWSLALYAVSIPAAFVIGAGLLTMQTADEVDPTVWQVLVAGIPALLVMMIPGILAVVLGRSAIRLGRPDGKVPAIVGAAIGLAFLGLNLAQGLLMLVFG